MTWLNKIYQFFFQINMDSVAYEYSENRLFKRITLILIIFLFTIYGILLFRNLITSQPININDLRILLAAIVCLFIYLLINKKPLLAKILLSFIPMFILVFFPPVINNVTDHMFFISSLVIVSYSTLSHFIFNFNEEMNIYLLVILVNFSVLLFSEYFLRLVAPESLGWEYKEQWFFYIKLSEVLTFIYLNVILLTINIQNGKYRKRLFNRLSELYIIKETLGNQNEEILDKNADLVDFQLELQDKNQKLVTRTDELNEQNKQINKLYADVKLTYDQLIKSEKMATLGQLTSGIVHVIDQPIFSTQKHLRTLESDLQTISEILEKYLYLNHENFEEQIKIINELKTKARFDELIEHIFSLPKSVSGDIKEAIELIKELKSFSSSNQLEMINSDVLNGLNTTLNLIEYQYNDQMVITRDFSPIPLICCYPGRINQAFMNLLNWSIKILFSEGEKIRHQINLRTYSFQNEEQVMAKFQIGFNCQQKTYLNNFTINDIIPFNEAVQSFQPIDLSIAANIIKEHQGTLEIHWHDGQCNINIILPVTQS